MLYHGLQLRVYNMLKAVPWSRERRNKDLALVKLLTNQKPWDGELCVFRQTELVELVKDYNSADRFWRKCLEENPEIRGKDYEDKVKYAQKKELSLGYEPGYHQLSRMKV